MNETLTEIPEGFKETEIGLIPADWDLVRLEDVARVNYGKARPKTSGTIPVVGSGGTYAFADRPLVDFPTVVIGRKGTAGRAWFVQTPCWPSDTTFFLAWKKPVEARYVFAYLELTKLSGEHARTTLPSLQRQALENLPMALPPLPEQRKIALVLSTIQRAIEQQDNIIAAARELKRSLMRQLFRYGPVPMAQAERVSLKETEISPVPEHWGVATLEEVCEPRRETVQPTGTGRVRYVGLQHIEPERVRLRRHGFDDEVRSTKSAFYVHDILYGKLRPYLDKAAIAEFQGMCSTDILVLQVSREKAVANFLVQLFHHPSFLCFATSTMTGTQHPRTSWRALSRFELGLPPLREQQEIASILFTVDHKIEAEEHRKALLQELFKSMLHKLMTGQIRVKDIEV